MKIKTKKKVYTMPEVSCMGVESFSLLASSPKTSTGPQEKQEEEDLTGDDNGGILGV